MKNKQKSTPFIGKNVIETLTSGMYDDSRFVYREYVQNAADQIDVAVEEGILKSKKEGKIEIIIDENNKRITIEDNATGIKMKNTLSFLSDVANSQKDREKRKGFRGIGRLGGLGYCEKLIFETSYRDENIKSIVTLDAKELKDIINDKSVQMDAATLMSIITDFAKEDEEKGLHYFKVTMQDVTSAKLLDVDYVKDYLLMVAPVPFKNSFPFKEKIHNYFFSNNVSIDEYSVELKLNDFKLEKPYKEHIFDNKGNIRATILDVNFHKIQDESGELVAIAWYAVTNKLNFQILIKNNLERGLRLRKDNIGIGTEDTLGRLFKEKRQVLNYVGEVYAIGSNFIPNARRDYFNDNTTLQYFEEQMKVFLANLGDLVRISSVIHSRKREIVSHKSKLSEFVEKSKSGQTTEEEQKRLRSELRKTENIALKAKEKIENVKLKNLDNEDIVLIYKNVVGTVDTEFVLIDELNKKGYQNFPITLSQLNENEKKIVKEIFEILKGNLSPHIYDMIKKKIAMRYN